jgi:hypothetical protein
MNQAKCVFFGESVRFPKTFEESTRILWMVGMSKEFLEARATFVLRSPRPSHLLG